MAKSEILDIDDFSKICRACLCRGYLKSSPDTDEVFLVYQKLTNPEVENEEGLPRHFCVVCIKQIEDIGSCIDTWKNNDTLLRKSLAVKQEGDSFQLENDDDADSLNGSKRFHCNLCERSFAQKGTLTRHRLTHTGAKPFKCNNCGKTTSRKDLINDHINKHHRDDLNCGFTVTKLKVVKNVNNDSVQIKRDDSNKGPQDIKCDKYVEVVLKCIGNGEEYKVDRAETLGKITAPYLKSEFTCDLCKLRFTKKSELRRHTKIHIGSTRYTCEVCQRDFAQKGTLTRHLVTHIGTKPFKCNKCDKTTNRKDLITDHIIKHHPDDMSCGFTVTEVIDGIKRETVVQDVEFCKSYKDLQQFGDAEDEKDDENEVQNGESTKKIKKKKPPDPPSMCNLCGKFFKRKDYLKNHLAVHGKSKPHECNFCEKGFSHKHALKRHILTHTKERPFQCNICGNTYTRKIMLSEHIKTHEVGEKPYLCSHCGKSFSHKYGLRKHLKYVKDKSENMVKPEFKCQLCGKQFFTSSYLKAHILSHTGEKPYMCTDCGARFTWKRSLKEHMSIHDGIKPFQCSQCEKVFRTANSLRKHSLLHTGKRSYQCTLCPKAFVTANTLKMHVWRHSGERPFSCTSCHKKFIQRNHLQRHLRTHKL